MAIFTAILKNLINHARYFIKNVKIQHLVLMTSRFLFDIKMAISFKSCFKALCHIHNIDLIMHILNFKQQGKIKAKRHCPTDYAKLWQMTPILIKVHQSLIKLWLIIVRKLEGFPAEVSLDLTFVGSFHEIIAFLVFCEEF